MRIREADIDNQQTLGYTDFYGFQMVSKLEYEFLLHSVEKCVSNSVLCLEHANPLQRNTRRTTQDITSSFGGQLKSFFFVKHIGSLRNTYEEDI